VCVISRQQVIALAILGMAVLTVYALGVVMAADVLQMVRAEPPEPPAARIFSKSRGNPLRLPTWAGARPALTPRY
jgi:hypothetical protein